MVGWAVKVISVPEQEGFWEAVTVTVIVKTGLTVITIVLEDAGFPLAQGAFEFKIQLTISAFTGI